MPAPFPRSQEGSIIHNTSGFPLYFEKRIPRVITADVWSFLGYKISEKVNSKTKPIALAFLEQAYDFFESANTHSLSSKPILYYYSFLNLVKTFLLSKGVNIPPKVNHGISDPKLNNRERLRLPGQVVLILMGAW